ncbi:hypothetical protein Cfor_04108 [Coptotermes formosanus]|uniref:Spermatogenesis-associated protein 22 n=1 Tax=Coptotermes formosanus TaxID=36987 RepID=A0A6L2PJQ2_COPFO|nr:hypothetical protein Cfor_04108 [Coptotermes formosanus]
MLLGSNTGRDQIVNITVVVKPVTNFMFTKFGGFSFEFHQRIGHSDRLQRFKAFFPVCPGNLPVINTQTNPVAFKVVQLHILYGQIKHNQLPHTGQFDDVCDKRFRPYQRNISGGEIRQNTYGGLEDISPMKNATRFPSRMMSSNQMMPQYNNPGPSSSRYGYPYLQDLPFHSEQQTYTPLAMKAYSSFAARGNAWHFQSEDETSDKESPYKQLNQSPTTSLPKKSGHRVRFSFQTTEKTNQISNSSRSTLTGTDSFKPPKRRQDDSRPLRVLTGSTDKAIKWEKVKDISAVLFEVIATLVAVRPGGYRCEQMLLLRDEATPALQCVFYTIDRPLPPLEKGQLVRCVGEMLTKNKLKAYSVRAASMTEKSGLQRLSFASQRAVAALELSIPEP